MLGRLHMTAKECRDAYLKLSERVFNPRHKGLFSTGKQLWQAKGRFDSGELEDAIKDTIADCKLENAETFKDPEFPCKA